MFRACYCLPLELEACVGRELTEVTLTPCVCPVPLLQTVSGLRQHLAEHSKCFKSCRKYTLNDLFGVFFRVQQRKQALLKVHLHCRAGVAGAKGCPCFTRTGMSRLSMPGSCTADLSFGASSPETLLGDTCSRSPMALRSLTVLPAPHPVLAMGMGGEAAPACIFPRAISMPEVGKLRPVSGRGCVKLTLQLPGNMPKWKYAQIS